MAKLDNKIIKLKETINKKQKNLELLPTKFSPRTNCMFSFFDGHHIFNLHTLNENELCKLRNQLSVLNKEEYKPVYNGSELVDWIIDIDQKIGVINYKKELNKLNDLKLKLDSLLSEDKKKELELEEIEKMLIGS